MSWRLIIAAACLLLVATAACYLACYGGVAQDGTWIGRANLIVGVALGIISLFGLIMTFVALGIDAGPAGPHYAPVWEKPDRPIPTPPVGGTGASRPSERGSA